MNISPCMKIKLDTINDVIEMAKKTEDIEKLIINLKRIKSVYTGIK